MPVHIGQRIPSAIFPDHKARLMSDPSRKKIYWPDQLMNFIGVVVGVLLALGLANWNEDRKENRRVRIALENIGEEVRKNQARIDSNLTQNDRQREFIMAYLDASPDTEMLEPSPEVLQKLREKYPEYIHSDSDITVNFQLYPLSAVAYETTIRTGLLGRVDFELAYHLEQVYMIQRQLMEQDQEFLELMKTLDGSRKSMERVVKSVTLIQQFARVLSEQGYPGCMEKIEKIAPGDRP